MKILRPVSVTLSIISGMMTREDFMNPLMPIMVVRRPIILSTFPSTGSHIQNVAVAAINLTRMDISLSAP